MGAPVLNGPFTMPMFRDFVPRALQPWIYIFMAATFQLSGGIYLGALNEMIGGMALMREDLMMCLYANLAGMAIYFPILFRMKFRFTNRTLLTAAAAGALVCNLVAPLALCLWRMNTIRHPYIEPRMWSYRHLFPILILITLVEMLLATEHVLEGAFYEQTMHYDATVSVLVTRWVLVGVLAGCGFAYWWMHVRRMSYVRLLTVGIAALAAYLLGYYFTVSADIHVSQLYLPAACRGFAYAILSATFMVCLEEIMTFQHFFQALSVFNMLHMVVGGVIGAAIYTEAFTYYTADNMARYGAAVDSVAFTRAPFDMGAFMEGFAGRMIETSVKQVYGWAAYACIGLLLLFLLYDAPARRALKPIPMWRTVRSDVARSLRRIVVRR